MKKNLRSQIKMLASKILKQEETANAAELKSLAKELYEKLTVLDYFESQLTSDETPKSLDSKSFREENWFTEPEPVPQPENKEVLAEPLMEKIKDIVAQMPQESQQVDALLEEVLPEKKYTKNDLEDFASDYQETPVLERKIVDTTEPIPLNIESSLNTQEKPKSLNDAMGGGLTIGLNDRMAFIKHLFGGNTDEYTRVLSLIATMSTFDEANDFIQAKVKPDYNYWLKKDDISERFLTIIEKNFN